MVATGDDRRYVVEPGDRSSGAPLARREDAPAWGSGRVALGSGRLSNRRARYIRRQMKDQELLLAVGQGDRAAFVALMERYTTVAMKVAQRMTGSVDDAEEVAQEAFLRVWTHAHRWNSEGGAQFSTWFYRIVVNLCLDRRRRIIMVPIDVIEEPVDPKPTGMELYSIHKTRQVVTEALAKLPARQRAAISLCYFGEVSCQEAADVLDVSLSALESLLVRGRRSLRSYFLRRDLRKMGDVV